MGKLLKGSAILSILAFFFCAGWVVVTADGVAFRYFLISAMIFVFTVFGGFAWLVYREVNRREKQAIIAGDAVAEIVEKLQSNNRNLN